MTTNFESSADELETRRTNVFKMGLRTLKFRKLKKLEGRNRYLKKSLDEASEKIRDAIRNYNGSVIRRGSASLRQSGRNSVDSSFENEYAMRQLNASLTNAN
jgi:hypothetical protein